MASLRIYLKEAFRWNYTLLDREVYIGRSRENHIVLPHPEVSRHQAVIQREGNQYIAVDRSGKGLKVNGNTSEKMFLKQGDLLRVGAFRLIFESDQPEDKPSDTMTWESTIDIPLQDRPNEKVGKCELVVVQGPDEGKRISIGNEVIRVGRSIRGNFPLSDKTISNVHLEIESTAAGIQVRDMGSTNGTRIDGRSIQSQTIEIDSEIRIGKTTLKISLEEVTLPVSHTSLGQLIGQASKMVEVYYLVRKGATSGAPVLIQGETGCGKELVAKEVHRLSPRAKRPFITVDCSSIPKDLIESELFGHEKGSFTSAIAQRKGAFELADGGTIFLDEIGELPIEMQPKLLRVLEEKHFKRIGGSELIRSDFRVISATNRWLDQEVMNGRFRQDLFFRLYVLPVFLPPLRERREDIPLLVAHFLKGKAVEVPKEVLDRLIRHSWPGNVRELRNVMERGVVMMEGNRLRSEDLLFLRSEKKGNDPMPWEKSDETPPPESLEEIEKQVIRRTLKSCEGDKKQVAKTLGIALSTLYEKIKRYRLDSD